MKKTSSILLMVFCFVLTACGQTNKENSNLPQPKGFVNDFENLLMDRQEEYLDSLIIDYEKQTKIEIAIVTLDSTMTSAETFDNYTLELANYWGVGKKDLDNGVLIGVSSTLRRIIIQNGLGIEEILSDEETKKIIDAFFIPNFKNGDYFEGIKLGLIEVMEKLK
ncbi:TPM domain-containing protein [Confluentibacter sediminis]|uniref:TPM domain-containing protein n=1 Tax=Confluentibacter sediminis TaxID=2219045 RepID=UPI000DABA8F4|nr:TPM domain-containing protein [Confluentibacter sediminis]